MRRSPTRFGSRLSVHGIILFAPQRGQSRSSGRAEPRGKPRNLGFHGRDYTRRRAERLRRPCSSPTLSTPPATPSRAWCSWTSAPPRWHWLRLGLGALVLVPLARVLHPGAGPVWPAIAGASSGWGCSALPARLHLSNWGLARSTASDAALLITVEPAAVILLSPLLLGERLTRPGTMRSRAWRRRAGDLPECPAPPGGAARRVVAG